MKRRANQQFEGEPDPLEWITRHEAEELLGFKLSTHKRHHSRDPGEELFQPLPPIKTRLYNGKQFFLRWDVLAARNRFREMTAEAMSKVAQVVREDIDAIAPDLAQLGLRMEVDFDAGL
jgi:hypothetical protein